MMALPRMEQQLVTVEKPVAAPSTKFPNAPSKISALSPPKKPVLAVTPPKKSAKATPKKSSMATTKKGKTGTSHVSKSGKKSTKKVTISEKVEYEGEYEDYEEGYEEGYDEDYYEDWDGYEDEYEYADYDEEEWVSEDSEGWNMPRPWLFPDPDGSKMVANFKRFHAINRDIAPHRLKKMINCNPYQEPYVLRPEAKCESLFKHFSKLKSKLRKLIWEFALPEECRVVAIYQHAGEYANTDEPDTFAIQSYGKLPTLLRVNHESRKVAKHFYTLAFNAVSGRPQYFDFRLDALHLWGVNPEFVEKLPYIKGDLAKVQNLAVHGAGLLSDADQYPRLRHFTNLKTLLVEKPYENVNQAIATAFYEKIENGIGRLFDDVIENLHCDAVVKPVKSRSGDAKSKKLTKGLDTADSSSKKPVDDPMDVDKQVEPATEAPSAPDKSSKTAEWADAHAVASGVVESMPEIDTLIDQAIADMSDVDMLIDESIAEPPFADAIHVQPNDTADVPMTLETPAKVDTPPVPVASTTEDKQTEAVDVPITEISGEKSTVSAGPAKELESREIPVVKQRTVVIGGVEYTGAITILYKKAEDILEIVIDSSQWPERVDKENKHWKWYMPMFRPRWVNGSRLLNSYYRYMDSVPTGPLPVNEPASSSSEAIAADEPSSSSSQSVAADEAASSSSQSVVADHDTSLTGKPLHAPIAAAISGTTPTSIKPGPVMGVFRLPAPEEQKYVSPYPPTEPAKAVPKIPAGFFAAQTTPYISPYLPKNPAAVVTKLPAGSVAAKPTMSVSPNPPKEPAKVIRKLPAGLTAQKKTLYISPYAPISSSGNKDEVDLGDTGGITGGIAEGITGPAIVPTPGGGGGVLGSFLVLRHAAGSLDEETPGGPEGDTGSITGGIAEGITGPVTRGTLGSGLVGSFGVFRGLTSVDFGGQPPVDSDGDPMALDN
ncbi:hypothetical protein DL95DRAFT_475435 [Leptodontidium sp. 2 PMI_412]|nr:hypothetical protein DL95DRAFT_475435 [Leptodontidium sp. 2 PMI_412]